MLQLSASSSELDACRVVDEWMKTLPVFNWDGLALVEFRLWDRQTSSAWRILVVVPLSTLPVGPGLHEVADTPRSSGPTVHPRCVVTVERLDVPAMVVAIEKDSGVLVGEILVGCKRLVPPISNEVSLSLGVDTLSNDSDPPCYPRGDFEADSSVRKEVLIEQVGKVKNLVLDVRDGVISKIAMPFGFALLARVCATLLIEAAQSSPQVFDHIL